MTSHFLLVGFGIFLVLIQLLVALPWLIFVSRDEAQQVVSQASRAGGTVSSLFGLIGPVFSLMLLFHDQVVETSGKLGLRKLLLYAGGILGATVVLGALLGFGLSSIQDPDTLQLLGRVYGAVLLLQLAVDLLVLFFALLLLVWPKGGAVAVAAFREGYRQPMFWLLVVGALLLMFASPLIPYFTFGEDHKMVEELGYDTIMLFSALFGILAASMSISEEIEGRTAITLMSKPVSRRQFLLGKFVGILMAILFMVTFLGWWFDWSLVFTRWYQRVDPVPVPLPLKDFVLSRSMPVEAANFVHGIDLWSFDALRTAPGLALGSCQAMVLLAIAVSLATRLPMVVNLVTCLAIYFLGHLTPVLLQIAHHYASDVGGLPVSQMLSFMAQLFDTLLPWLEGFGLGPAVVREAPMPLGPFLIYVGSVILYAGLYTMIPLLLGLVLFEDRDLA
jgi:ABC-type transport system involved in multi-copper enzyme maturation permease subunit